MVYLICCENVQSEEFPRNSLIPANVFLSHVPLSLDTYFSSPDNEGEMGKLDWEMKTVQNSWSGWHTLCGILIWSAFAEFCFVFFALVEIDVCHD